MQACRLNSCPHHVNIGTLHHDPAAGPTPLTCVEPSLPDQQVGEVCSHVVEVLGAVGGLADENKLLGMHGKEGQGCAWLDAGGTGTLCHEGG